jgi:hypothetical protein
LSGNERIEHLEYAGKLVDLVDHQHRRHVALRIDQELRAEGATPAERALGSGERALTIRHSDGKAEPEPVAGSERILALPERNEVEQDRAERLDYIPSFFYSAAE